jgi:DNA-directed RNA polymerase beta subunit
VDDIDPFGQQETPLMGELLQNQFRIGLARMEKSLEKE